MSTKYKMRPLKTADIYKMSKILKKMNLELEVGDGTTQAQLGVQDRKSFVINEQDYICPFFYQSSFICPAFEKS